MMHHTCRSGQARFFGAIRIGAHLGKLVVGGIVLLAAGSAHASPAGGNAYFFGASTTDCCNFGPYGNGKNYSDQLPPLIGENYVASKQTNLAIGGAQSGYDNATPALQSAYGSNTGFLAQVARFTAQATTIGPNDLATVQIGDNDIWTSSYMATDTIPGQPTVAINRPLGVQPSVSALSSYVVGNIQSGINQLKADGFQNVLLISSYDFGQSAIVPAADKALATAYTDAITALESQLYTSGVNTYFVNEEQLLRDVQADPGAYGFAHTTATDTCNSACTVSYGNYYVFNDIIHPTAQFNQLIANEAAAVILAGTTIPAPVPEPSSVLLVLVALGGLGMLHRGSMQSGGRLTQSS